MKSGLGATTADRQRKLRSSIWGTTIEERGFTLLELVITVAIVGILAVIAYPSYRSAVQKNNRAAAESVLMDIAQREQQYLLDNRGSYAASVTALNYSVPSNVATLYTIALGTTVGPPPTFTASATPISGTVQATDLGGAPLTINNAGTKSPSGAW
jgi:type IV pilus assembly protein PilE